MALQVSLNHPLRALFAELVERHLVRAAQLDRIDVARYIAGLLVDFTHVDNLYRLRDARGRRLEDVGEMLIASNPLFEARSFIEEREIRRHIGDYTLFLAGLFPEYVARLPRARGRLDSLVDYVKAGKESYAVVASFDQFEFRDQAALFRELSDRFELCIFGLNMAARDLAGRERAWYQGVRDLLH
ncbi:MAG TPA: hypothetical protein VN442_19970 [Bryobacteraceae bacterium]|nr:hypothetical protein [Bryobacteraceae bacterium]